MRILLAVHNFPPEFRGGVERAVEALAETLLAGGDEPLIVTGSTEVRSADDPPEFAATEWRGIPVRRWHRAPGYHNYVDAHDPELEAAFEVLLSEVRPEILHVHHWSQLSTDLCALARRQGIPSLATMHDHWITCGRFFRLPSDELCQATEAVDPCVSCLQQVWGVDESELTFSLAMRQASLDQELSLLSAVTVSSQSHLDLLQRYGRYSEDIWKKFRVMPMGTEPAVANPKTVSPNTDPKRRKLVVAHWGNLSALKGVEVLARAAAQAKVEGLELQFLGQTVDAALETRVRELAGDCRVEFSGSFDPENLAQLLQGVDCAVFPSLAFETHSLVVDEAMALGLPIIVSDRGAPRERLGGRGLVVAAQDHAALAEALEKMADPEFRLACLNADTGLVSRESWASAMKDLYAEVADDQHSPTKEPNTIVPDLTRIRLAARNQRLAEIAQYVGGLSQAKTVLEQAVLGDADALAQLTQTAPHLAARIDKQDEANPENGS